MCAAWKKKNERNDIWCFYGTQSDILLCGIARFSRGNKNKLRTFQPQKWKKIENSQPETKFTGFCMITASIMKELILSLIESQFNFSNRFFLSIVLFFLLTYVQSSYLDWIQSVFHCFWMVSYMNFRKNCEEKKQSLYIFHSTENEVFHEGFLR